MVFVNNILTHYFLTMNNQGTKKTFSTDLVLYEAKENAKRFIPNLVNLISPFQTASSFQDDTIDLRICFIT